MFRRGALVDGQRGTAYGGRAEGSEAENRAASRVVRGTGLGLLLVIVGAAPAAAYKQFIPTGNYLSCADTNTSPCVEWPKTAQNLSVNVDVYLSSTLANATLDLRPNIQAVFPKYNDIAARNPHLQQTTSTSDEEVWVALANIENDPSIFGVANVRPSCTPYPADNWACAAPGYKIFAATIYLNSLTTWNNSYSYGCNLVLTSCWADSRTIATHEFGHVEGLAHVNPSESFEAVMKAPIGPTYLPTKWWPNSDDHAGIIAIYGAYP